MSVHLVTRAQKDMKETLKNLERALNECLIKFSDVPYTCKYFLFIRTLFIRHVDNLLLVAFRASESVHRMFLEWHKRISTLLQSC